MFYLVLVRDYKLTMCVIWEAINHVTIFLRFSSKGCHRLGPLMNCLVK